MSSRVPTILLAMLVLAGALPPNVEADTLFAQPNQAQPRWGMATVWAGDRAYAFGGMAPGCMGQCVEVLASIDVLDFLEERPPANASLPRPLAGAGAVWDARVGRGQCAEGCAYILGGRNATLEDLDGIVRFDPDLAQVETIGALPSPRSEAGTVWDGTRAYLFGGVHGRTVLDEIVAFDPQAGTATVVGHLPHPRAGITAFWDDDDQPSLGCPGGCAYLVGGRNISNPWESPAVREILRWNPITGATVLAAELQISRDQVALAWTGEVAYLFAGFAGGCCADEILIFHPQSGVVETSHERLGTHLQGSAFWDPRGGPMGCAPGCAYVVGYNSFGGGPSAFRYSPSLPPAATNVRVNATTMLPGFQVTWAPVEGHGVSLYRVYRAIGQAPWQVLAEVPATATSYADLVWNPSTGNVQPALLGPDAVWYRVVAINAAGDGPPSLAGCARGVLWTSIEPLPAPPLGTRCP